MEFHSLFRGTWTIFFVPIFFSLFLNKINYIIFRTKRKKSFFFFWNLVTNMKSYKNKPVYDIIIL